MPPQFTNPFIPTEPGDLPPVSMPNIPPPERPTQTETTLVASTQTKGFGKKLLQATMDHFNKKGFIPNGSPIELGPRTQLMFLPTEATSQINRLAGFDPRIQMKYPEAYALASEIDKFGREKVTLLRVSMEEHERSRNQSELARTVKKVSVQVVKVWNNPRFQGSIQAAGGLAEAGLGAVVSIGSGGLAAPGGLALMAHGLDHYFTGMQTAFSGTHRDTVTVQALQGLGLSHNVSELVDTGISVGGGVGAGRALAVAPKMTMTRGLLVQEQMVKRVAAQKAFIERMNSPAYRSGLVSEGTVAKLAEKNVSQIRTDWVFPKKGGATINGRWYTEHALERMAPRTPEVMAELEVRALTRAAKKGYKPQTKDFGDWWKDHKPNPRNIPPSVVEAEIANPGSTNIRVELNKKGDVITVIPVGQK